ncbi:hypothetical protein TorRG33x02_267290 [Trema orientale]|uniref:Uncharacterized protein n=1 Tax=Trema orientale TaxID=63057 RepID=A0A2P5D082_TREOI|nr:hypothetical protein TorRG33x02_267290 [Trema orientale]
MGLTFVCPEVIILCLLGLRKIGKVPLVFTDQESI